MVTVTRTPGPVSAKQLAVILEGMNGYQGKAGWFESSKTANGTPMAYIAAIQNYGYAAGGIPPRPIMEPTIRRNQAAWTNAAKQGSLAVLNGKATMQDVFTQLSGNAAGEIQKTISSIYSPALKEATIKSRVRRAAQGKSKGTIKPLIDTGAMFDAVTFNVEKTK